MFPESEGLNFPKAQYVRKHWRGRRRERQEEREGRKDRREERSDLHGS